MTPICDKHAELKIQLLQALNSSPCHQTAANIQATMIASEIIPTPAVEIIREQLNLLVGADLVYLMGNRSGGEWIIGPQGISELRGYAKWLAANTEPERPPIQATVCRTHEPAIATLCVAEEELDGWWDDFDVEIKAAVFSMWTLGSDRAFARGIEREDHSVRARLSQPANGKDYTHVAAAQEEMAAQ